MKLSEDINKDFFGIPPPIGRKSQKKRVEGIILESANIHHGFNCDCCTSVKDSQRFGDEYEKKIKQLHKGRYVGFRARKAKRQEQQPQSQKQDEAFLAFPKQDDSNPMEDFEPL